MWPFILGQNMDTTLRTGLVIGVFILIGGINKLIRCHEHYAQIWAGWLIKPVLAIIGGVVTGSLGGVSHGSRMG